MNRYPKNPILTKKDIPYEVHTVHNAGIAKYKNEYIMLFRSHLATGRSILGIARSPNGYEFKADPEPFITPMLPYEEYGVEDARISQINGRYIITYSAYSKEGIRIALAETKDFQRLSRHDVITEGDGRNVVIFPEKIQGMYRRLSRPHTEKDWGIWISESPDLVYWGRSRRLMGTVPYSWEEEKIGPGATPIKTDKGWLVIYHGCFSTMAGSVYRLGVALLDLEYPSVVLARSKNWILQPEEPYEVTGYVNNVVFTCGAIKEEDDSIKIYYGAADSVMALVETNVDSLLEMCYN